MKLLSLDLEMNQPSDKIIQMGYVIFDVKRKKIIKSVSIFVNPEELLAEEIVQLTGITQDQVDSGVSLPEAYNNLKSDIEQHQVTRHCLEWGPDDRFLRDQLSINQKDFIFRSRSYDVKSFYQMYQAAKSNGKVHSGLKSSMETLGLSWNGEFGQPHNALADAYNTVLIYLFLVDKMVRYDKLAEILK